LLAIEDSDKVATLNREIANLPATLCDELEDRFLIDEGDEGGPSGKASGKTKAKKSSENEDALEEEQPRRRGYFPARRRVHDWPPS
jgi:hypothetical protein